ncbi:hypothetical protein RRG08_054433 [Elysia crispata]|uniref:Uncharacterized protein n=1 Tax=Elysia crispata TaxID=231223 RepID=A0AAE1AW67_9GAST|nr:hypothetical protein RRG08_054433 [Elysia crispata]
MFPCLDGDIDFHSYNKGNQLAWNAEVETWSYLKTCVSLASTLHFRQLHLLSNTKPMETLLRTNRRQESSTNILEVSSLCAVPTHPRSRQYLPAPVSPAASEQTEAGEITLGICKEANEEGRPTSGNTKD